MLTTIPTNDELKKLLNSEVFAVWESLADYIMQNNSMDVFWDTGRKAGVYEYKFRKGGKTLCAFYARENSFGFMIIFGQGERENFEANRRSFSRKIQEIYDSTRQYHDGKWIMIDVQDATDLPEIKQLLLIKKKQKKK